MTLPPAQPVDEHGPLPVLKGVLPFRLGATSYVLPEDVVPNVEWVAPLVDDVEILCFEPDTVSPLLSDAALHRLADLAREHGLTYTVHLPLDAAIGATDESMRAAAADSVYRVMTHMTSLAPFAYILHAPAGPEVNETVETRAEWTRAVTRSVRELLAAGIEPERLCLETVDYPFEWLDRVVGELGLSVCLDVGHLLRYGHAVESILSRHRGRIRVVHLHGVVGARDHRSLATFVPGELLGLLKAFSLADRERRVVTVEVFQAAALAESLRVLEQVRLS